MPFKSPKGYNSSGFDASIDPKTGRRTATLIDNGVPPNENMACEL
jgi:hypothetical protein